MEAVANAAGGGTGDRRMGAGERGGRGGVEGPRGVRGGRDLAAQLRGRFLGILRRR